MDGAPEPLAASPPLQPEAGGPLGLACRWVPAAGWPALLPAWTALAGRAAPCAFLDPAFALAAREADAAPGLGAFLVEREGEALGLLPGRFGLGGTLFRVWAHDFAPLGLALLARGAEAAVLAALLAALEARGTAALAWPFLEEGSPAEAALARLCAAGGRRADDLGRHARAALGAGEAPVAAKELRRLGRRLAEAGPVAHLTTAAGLARPAARQAFLALEAGGWKGRRGTALASAPRLSGLVEAALDAEATRIDLLTVGGRPVAGAAVLTAGDRAWYWKTAYDEAFARFSPGTLMALALGEALAAEGRFALVDSCAVPGHPMIERVWPDRLGMAHRLVAVRPGWRYGAVLAALRGRDAARGQAKAALARLRRARATAGG